MSTSIANEPSSAHRVIPEVDRRAVKAQLRKSETVDFRAQIGAAIARAAQIAGFNLEQLAGAVDKDPRQVRRWMDGTERPQFDSLFAVPELQQPLVIALAALADHGVEITTSITLRRAS